jgi:hypothetical protein
MSAGTDKLVPQIDALLCAKLASAHVTPSTAINARCAVDPQFFWHIMPTTLKIWSGAVSLMGRASNPQSSSAEISAITLGLALAFHTTMAFALGCDATALSTPGTASNALCTVLPQFFWHIMPSTRSKVVLLSLARSMIHTGLEKDQNTSASRSPGIATTFASDMRLLI